jgi:hypothetical protein
VAPGRGPNKSTGWQLRRKLTCLHTLMTISFASCFRSSQERVYLLYQCYQEGDQCVTAPDVHVLVLFCLLQQTIIYKFHRSRNIIYGSESEGLWDCLLHRDFPDTKAEKCKEQSKAESYKSIFRINNLVQPEWMPVFATNSKSTAVERQVIVLPVPRRNFQILITLHSFIIYVRHTR